MCGKKLDKKNESYCVLYLTSTLYSFLLIFYMINNN